MKKKIIAITLACLIIIAVGVAVYFAYFKVDAEKLAYQNISEQDEVCYVANNGASQVKLISGTRENPYLLNGRSEAKQDFALLIFRSEEQNVEAPTFVANINDKSYNGILQNNPYDNTFVIDLEQKITEGAIINVKITINDDTYNYDLTSKSAEWSISCEQATKIAIDHFMDKIKANASHSGLNGELFLRIISDNTSSFDNFFYHATLTLTQQEYYSIVIDVNTGDIIN